MSCIRSKIVFYFSSTRDLPLEIAYMYQMSSAHLRIGVLRWTRLLSPVILNPIPQPERFRHHMKAFLRTSKCFFSDEDNLRPGAGYIAPASSSDSRNDICSVMQWTECVQHHLSHRQCCKGQLEVYLAKKIRPVIR